MADNPGNRIMAAAIEVKRFKLTHCNHYVTLFIKKLDLINKIKSLATMFMLICSNAADVNMQ